MKITDKVLQRTIDLALVAKPAANAVFGGDADWSRPVCYEVTNSSETFVRMPHGQYAVRVISRHAVDLLVHVDGQLRRRVSLPKGINYVDTDGDGQPLFFLEKGETAKFVPQNDQDAIDGAPTVAAEQGQLGLADDNVQVPLVPPSGHGLVFVVARFTPELTPGLKPPAQEYEATFQMNAPQDHDELLASSNLLHMVPPDTLINLDDELSFEPSQKHRPSFVCTCTGCRHGGSMRNF